MKTRWLYTIAAALIIISCSAVKPAIAYFTDTISKDGKILVTLGDGELDEIDENVTAMVKRISIKNTGAYDVFVRAKAIFPAGIEVEKEESTGWGDLTDGYYYYDEIVSPGESTERLNLKITSSIDDDFNVIIIQEATKVLYDADGNPYADWNNAITAQLGSR